VGWGGGGGGGGGGGKVKVYFNTLCLVLLQVTGLVQL
jgi:hypothetical protein